MLREFSRRDFQLRGLMPETPEHSALNAIDINWCRVVGWSQWCRPTSSGALASAGLYFKKPSLKS
jgi:hypothetical protein